MTPSLLTLTTDFGDASPYTAAMKGVILSINPAVRLLDLGHRLPPQDIRHASWFLAASLPCFPPAAIHVVVVDPGVGSDRAVLYVEVQGHRVVAPDNGCLTGFLDAIGGTPRVRRVTERKYFREPVSSTFHGRDIFAPVAAHLSLGLEPEKLGDLVSEWQRLLLPNCEDVPGGVRGEVAFVDDFGNLITNIPADRLPVVPFECSVGDRSLALLPRVRTYAEAAHGELVTLTSSSGHLEFAVVQGSAARRIGVATGAPVLVKIRVE